MTLTWENINISVLNNNKSIKSKYLTLVKNNSGEAKNGEIVAIMGPSGGGKTTLLKALGGRIPTGSKTCGNIFYNEKKRDVNEWISNMGFVDQDDLVHDDLTVEETLLYAGLLRSKCIGEGGFSFKEVVTKKMNDLMVALRLGNCRKNKMIKVSGGERKRVMIAVELMSDPNILFLDEPTSGLDASTALSICKLLKELAVNKKMIVVLTIHQPGSELFDLFNNIILLSNGETIYNGGINEIEIFLQSHGIQKHGDITYPELMIKFCDSKNIELHDDYDWDMKNSHRIKRRNDIYYNLNFEFYHVYVLIKRSILIHYKRKWGFVKAYIIPYLIGCMFLSFFHFFHAYMNKIYYEQIMKDKNPFSSILITESKVIDTFETWEDYRIVFMFIQIGIISFIFLDKYTIYKREIMVGTYSTTSLYLSSFLYQFILHTCIQSLIVIGGNICKGIEGFGYLNIIFSVLITLVSIATGLFIASCTIDSRLIFTLSLIVRIFMLLYNTSFLSFLKKIEQKIVVCLSNILDYILIMLPSNNILYIIYILIYSNSSLKNLEGEHKNICEEIIQKIYCKNMAFLPVLDLPIWSFYIIFMCSFVVLIVIGLFLLCINLMPEFRINLGNEKKCAKLSDIEIIKENENQSDEC